VSVAAPGLKKSDFKINVEKNMLTISSETENREEKKTRITLVKSTTILLFPAVLRYRMK
jgi:HSP20 family molecular chaperone IbpA